jgi:hypothetical protein
MDGIDSLLKSLQAEDDVKTVVQDKPKDIVDASINTQRVAPEMFKTDKSLGLTTVEAEQRLLPINFRKTRKTWSLSLSCIFYRSHSTPVGMLAGSKTLVCILFLPQLSFSLVSTLSPPPLFYGTLFWYQLLRCYGCVHQAAAALAGGLQDWVDLGVICGPLVFNAVACFLQEYRAGNIVA